MIGIGFIGLGKIATMHYEAVLPRSDMALVAGHTRNQERLASVSQQWGFRPHSSLESLLRDRDVDAVVVLTPIRLHFEHARQALDAGKHVLVEKPVALQGGEIARLRSEAQSRGLVCMPGHNAIYRPALQVARERINDGSLGLPYFAQVSLSLPLPDSEFLGWRRHAAEGGSALVDSGTHRLYQTIYLMGRPSQVFAYTEHYKQPLDGEDVTLLGLRFASGALGVVFQSWASLDTSNTPELKVLGTKGTMWLSDQLYLDGQAIALQTPRPDTFRHMYGHFATCIRGEAIPLSTLGDAELTARTIEAAYRSAKEGIFVDIQPV
jgi:predicted dehydrogenase